MDLQFLWKLGCIVGAEFMMGEDVYVIAEVERLLYYVEDGLTHRRSGSRGGEHVHRYQGIGSEV